MRPGYAEAVLIEEFLDGPEISVESVCRDGRVTALFVAHKTLAIRPASNPRHLVHGDDPLLADPESWCRPVGAHRARLTDTATHTN